MTSADQATFEEIIGSVDELAKRAGTTSERAFAAWYAINFLDVDEDDGARGSFYRRWGGPGNRLSII